jgi:Tol biopolymer transport system component
VYVVDLATKERIRISSAGPRNANPTFSPDGKTIVWYGDSAGSYDLWSAPAVGGPPKRLTALPGAEIRPYFFDDGRRVAFARIEEGKGVRVGVLDLDTKESRLVTPEGFGEPRPLPGGRTLVCSGDREARPRGSGSSPRTALRSREGSRHGATGRFPRAMESRFSFSRTRTGSVS